MKRDFAASLIAVALLASPVCGATDDTPLTDTERSTQTAPSEPATPPAVGPPAGNEGKDVFRDTVRDATEAVADEAKSLTDEAVQIGKETIEKYSAEHEVISKAIIETAKWMDDFFKTTRNIEEENRSWLRVSAEARFEDGKGSDANVSTDLRLVLPTLEKRTSLIISTLAEDLDAPKKDVIPPVKGANTTTVQTNKDVAAGLRHIFTEAEGFNFRADLAMRYINLRPDPFGRIRLRVALPGEEMESSITSRLTWFSTTGFEAQAVADFDIKFLRRDLLRISPEIDWYEAKDKPGYFYGAPIRYFQPLGEKDALLYETYIWFSSYPTHHIDDFGFRGSYRRSIYKSWVFAEIGAWMRFPRERDFTTTLGAIIKVDTYFGYTE
ncbi:MAG: hypothetical protein HQK85_04535 [Nitrospinae bacterium]|nr:hypothetical protein [Nitrospinota bacterium]